MQKEAAEHPGRHQRQEKATLEKMTRREQTSDEPLLDL